MTRPVTPTDLVPPPRRSDDAFARSVQSDVATVKAARAPWRVLAVALPTTAMAAAAIVFTIGGRGGDNTSDAVPLDGAALAALLEAEVDAADDDFALDDVSDDDLVAFADVGVPQDQPVGFAFQDLDGSSEQDLAAIEAALDGAIRKL